MRKRISILALMMTMIFAFTACAKAEVENKDGKISVGVTIYPLQYFTERIGGDKVEVFSIIPDGSDAHTFDPKPKDLSNLTNTDIFIYNGLGMEEWIDSILNVVEGTEVKVVEASTGIKALPAIKDTDDSHEEETAEEHAAHEDEEDVDNSHEGETAEEHAAHADEDADNSHEGETAEEHAAHTDEEDEDHSNETAEDHSDHNHGAFDPHVWLSLDLAIVQAENIKNSLVEVDEVNKEYYESNFEALKNDLSSLKDEFSEKMSSLTNKEFVTIHAAFGYLTNDFGLNQSSIADVFGEGELTPKALENLINYAKEKNVKVIFSESTASVKDAETLAKGAGATVEKIYSLETKEDDLNYLDAMRYNLEKIYESLSK